MRIALGSVILAAALTATASCGGSGTAPPPTTPSPVPTTQAQTPSPLPYGQATLGGSLPCPPGGAPGRACSALVVACPSVPGASALLGITRPASTVPSRGTIILTTGAEGTLLDSAALTSSMISTFVRDGLVAVQVAWDPPGIWGDARARTVACRFATAAK